MLDEYNQKRDFRRTPEPGPESAPDPDDQLTFVIQRHDASRLHYDFRLELDGVLKSWAIPQGPSLNPKDRRLAVMVEDHPLSYGSFEGTIPKGQYGGGRVWIWDRGTYGPLADEDRPPSRREAEDLIRRGLAAGRLSFELHGEKLRGGWPSSAWRATTRTGSSPSAATPSPTTSATSSPTSGRPSAVSRCLFGFAW